MHSFVYTKANNIVKSTYVYIQKARQFEKKKDNLRYVFICKNPDTLRYAIFHDFMEIGIYLNRKYDNLRYVKCLYTKIQMLRKKEDNLS